MQPRVNPSGNKGNHHHLGKVLTLWLSHSFQQQRHSPMLCPTHQKPRSPNQMVNSAPDGQMCFRCKQPRHLKKDCPELPYCSKCHTRGCIPAKCPTKNKGNQQQDEKLKNGGKQMDERCENWKWTQDQPQFSNPNNRCLHCAGNHGPCDCPTRHHHQAPPTNNPVCSTSINSQYSPHFSQPSPPQHSQQSQSTARLSTPMLMINNPQQFQQGHQRHTAPPVQQQVNQQVRPPVSQQFNLQFNTLHPMQAPCFNNHHLTHNTHHPTQDSGHNTHHLSSNITKTSELITQVLDRSFKLYQDREDACKERER